MKLFWPAVPLIAMLCATASAQQGTALDEATIHQTVESLGAVISREYFDAEVATRTEAMLKQRLAQGRYAGNNTFESLAATLTRDLTELTHDKHLVVAVADGSDSESSPAQSAVQESRMSRGRRLNFGVQRVEILPGNIGYLNMTAFFRPEEARETIVAAMQTLMHADAFILDLRYNSGGSPDTAALLLSYFFDDASLLLFEIVPRSGEARGYTTETPPLTGRNGKRPTFVLTAERTFSAGEGMAFILQERGRAEVVGEKTAGAANPGRPYAITSKLEVTVPNGRVRAAATGRNWEGNGVVPDIKVAASDALRIAQMRALRQLLTTTPSGPWQDQLQRELDTLVR
jgi:hypothetical protein